MSQQITFKFLTYNIYLRPPLLNARGNDYKDKRLDQMLDYEIDKLTDVYKILGLEH